MGHGFLVIFFLTQRCGHRKLLLGTMLPALSQVCQFAARAHNISVESVAFISAIVRVLRPSAASLERLRQIESSIKGTIQSAVGLRAAAKANQALLYGFFPPVRVFLSANAVERELRRDPPTPFVKDIAVQQLLFEDSTAAQEQLFMAERRRDARRQSKTATAEQCPLEFAVKDMAGDECKGALRWIERRFVLSRSDPKNFPWVTEPGQECGPLLPAFQTFANVCAQIAGIRT